MRKALAKKSIRARRGGAAAARGGNGSFFPIILFIFSLIATPALVSSQESIFEYSNHIRPVEGWPVIVGSRIFQPPAIADIDGDGKDEISVGMYDGRVFLLNYKGKNLPGWPREIPSPVNTGNLIADIDGDGEPEILVCSLNGAVFAWHIDATPVDGWPVELGSGPSSAPRLVRRAGEAPLILTANRDGMIFLFHGDGTIAPGWPRTETDTWWARGDTRATLPADIDHDGIMEIVNLSRENTTLHCWELDGSPAAGFPVKLPVDEKGIGLSFDDPENPSLIACTTDRDLLMLDTEGKILKKISPLGKDDNFFRAPCLIHSGSSAESPPDLVAAASIRGYVYLWDNGGTPLPGWPVSLRGFIYGISAEHERHEVHMPIVSYDVDEDGEPEILMASYDQHLYCFGQDGTLLNSFPMTLGDMNISGVALAELDGKDGGELVVAQGGETLFAFHLGGKEKAEVLPTKDRGTLFGTVEWNLCFSVSIILIILLILFIAGYFRKTDLLKREFEPRNWQYAVLAIFSVLILARLVYLGFEIKRYAGTKEEVKAARSEIENILGEEELKVRRLSQKIAADVRLEAEPGDDPVLILSILERLADHYRLDCSYDGLAVTDSTGKVIQSVGLAKGLSGISNGEGRLKDKTVITILNGLPVFASGVPLGPANGYRALYLLSSLRKNIPNLITDSTGYSNYLRLRGRLLTYSGAGSSSNDLYPWESTISPFTNIELKTLEEDGGLTVTLADDSYRMALGGWADFLIVIIFPFILVILITSRKGRRAYEKRIGYCWILLFILIYLSSWFILSTHCFGEKPAPIAGYLTEVALHMAGLTGIILAVYSSLTKDRLKRLNYTLMGSYLLVSLLPMTLILILLTGVIRKAQNKIAQNRIEELTDRADNMVMRYKGDYMMRDLLTSASRELLSEHPESTWVNFVGQEESFFTYCFPSAYITLGIREMDPPGRYLTGFSYRAPRREKLYREKPAWAEGINPRGVFLEANRAFVRAMHTMKTPEIEAVLVSHIPIDDYIRRDLEERLRLLPFLPKVHLEPTWMVPLQARPPSGTRLPLGAELIIPARDWKTGKRRWISYRASAFLPPGGEKWNVILALALLAMMPFALSFLGAYYTFQKTGRPLARLLNGIQKVETGDLEYRLGSSSGQAEVVSASRAFDSMAESLERTVSELAEKKKVEEISMLKSRFISMVSHDLKTPLSSIKGAADNIMEGVAGPVSEHQQKYLKMILSSSDNLQRMLSDILNLSRIESGSLALERETLNMEIEVKNLLRSIQPLLDKKELKTRIITNTSHPDIYADRTRIWQILNNALSNSVRYSPSGGTIKIEIDKIGEAAESEVAEKSSIMVGITDQGPGIDEEERELLFEPFFSRPGVTGNNFGAGLGLTIVRQLVELHGGIVTIENSEGGGARLSFTLPAA